MFERQSMEQILSKMIRWTRGTTKRLTDFRVGSKVRTIYEATALVIEELYDKVYRSMKQLIEDNIYSVIGFNRVPATHANGQVSLMRHDIAEEDYLIPAGTTLLSKATQYIAPIQYRTMEDAILGVGNTSVVIPVVCITPGLNGNVGAGAINDFVMKPTGVDYVTNLLPIVGGQEEESKEEQKSRFQTFIEANARGVLQSVEYGALLSQVTSVNGTVTERVVQAVAIEDLPARRGEVDLYIWNGFGDASVALKAVVDKTLVGFYDVDGNAVYGYKPAGTQVNVFTAPIKKVKLKVIITPENTTVEALKPLVEQTIDTYFGSTRLGQILVQTALETEIKRLEGVYDVKLYISVDNGVTYNMDNVSVTKPGILVPSKPILYV